MEGIAEGERFQEGRFSITVLYADNHLLAVEKPANMPVQEDTSGDEDLLNACKSFVARRMGKPGRAYLGLVHRLDRPVGGTIVFARTSKAAARLSEAFRAHTVRKLYYAVGQGEPDGELALCDWLIKDERSGMVSVAAAGAPGAKEATLCARPLAGVNGSTLYEVELGTGRPHQIRVQLQHTGHPLWGDARYGGGQPGQQLALWAHSLTVPHPTLQTPVEFRSLPPDSGAWRWYRDILRGADCDRSTPER